MIKTKLKGGSLSGTYLINDGEHKFVRKNISLIKDRTYGYQRWYSQYKRLQRYSVLFPNIFPNVIGMGVDGKMSYFDMEYISGSKNGFEFLCEASLDEVDVFFDELIKTMKSLHKHKIPSNSECMKLYLYEEVEQRIGDALKCDEFSNFIKYDTIIFQGEVIPSFLSNFDTYKELALKHYKNPNETFTHGNLTLENTLYVPKNNNVVFIDPYEENVIDSDLAELSQLLQSSNSLYEIYNEHTPTIDGNNVSLSVDISDGITYFNDKLVRWIESNYDMDDFIIIKVLEISQFIRMLPFKVVVDKKKCIFFYSLASKLLNDLINKLKMN